MDFSIFRDNLRKLIATKGISIKQFSIDTDITSATLSRYFSGARTPDLIYVVRIAHYFGVTIDWLLGINEEKYSNLPNEALEIANRFMVASDDDKQVVRTVLNKYRRTDDETQ